jgi:hypothetical protein
MLHSLSFQNDRIEVFSSHNLSMATEISECHSFIMLSYFKRQINVHIKQTYTNLRRQTSVPTNFTVRRLIYIGPEGEKLLYVVHGGLEFLKIAPKFLANLCTPDVNFYLTNRSLVEGHFYT